MAKEEWGQVLEIIHKKNVIVYQQWRKRVISEIECSEEDQDCEVVGAQFET